ncbi:hypothetical protein WJX73_001359 [Symbiochloris irregularis]|uniref:Uncharacterized protein n=1 Tax=Symbiochloris irregularis TaxID=706552 RepID=A0AAW1NLN3_9CHLO
MLQQWQQQDIWTAEVDARVEGAALEYKYIVCGRDGSLVYWQPGCNQQLAEDLLPAEQHWPEQIIIADSWDHGAREVQVAASQSGLSTGAAIVEAQTPEEAVLLWAYTASQALLVSKSKGAGLQSLPASRPPAEECTEEPVPGAH